MGGLLLDGWAGTSPLFLLIGLLVGVVLAFFGTYRMAVGFLASQRNPGQQDEQDTSRGQ